MIRSRSRFAVIGTGAAAMGVLDALLSVTPRPEITVIDIGQTVTPEPTEGTPPRPFYDGLYDALRKEGLRGFPPPKTHFGSRLPEYRPGGLIESRSFGGLTNFWGATMLPFTRTELTGWPIAPLALQPHYARIAEITGISGASDPLDSYFGPDHVNRPPIPVTPSLARFRDRLNDGDGGHVRVLAGINRCAIETRPNASRQCTGCGECLAGCYRGAIYSARRTISTMLQEYRVTRIKGRVRSINPRVGSIIVEDASGLGTVTGFSRIFLAAGCLGTTEILLRSTGLPRSNALRTNSVHVFPVLNLGRGDGSERDHVALANLVLACIPRDSDAPMAQAQIYPNPDYLWRTQVPRHLWPIARAAIAGSRARLFWGRLFVHSDQSQTYGVTLNEDRLAIEPDTAPDRREPAQVLKGLRRAAQGGAIRVMTRPTVLQKSSAHYGSTFAYGNSLLPMPPSGEALPGVHVCDSTVFPDMPAVSPTFTIMANARRTAMAALDG